MHARDLAIAVLVTLLVVQTLRLAWTRLAPGWRLGRRRRRAAAGEREAEAILRAEGFRVEARQPTASLAYGIDGEDVVVDVRADLLVRRGGARYVAEVKTGAYATDPANRATRRQILEYAHAFGVDAVLLVDADRGRVWVVLGPTRAGARGGASVWSWSLVGVAVAVVMAVVMAGW